MNKVTIDRELLERATQGIEAVAAHFGSYQNEVVKELRAILAAAPSAPATVVSSETVQGEGLTRYSLFCSYDGGGPAEAEESPDGDYVLHADAQSVIAEVREECERLGREIYERNNELSACEAERDTLLQQRDKLAGLLRDERNWSCVEISCQRGVKDHCLCGTCRILLIDAALAEVNK